MIKIERIENIFRTMCFFPYNTETQGILPAKAGINDVLVILSFTTENTSQSDYIAAARSQNH